MKRISELKIKRFDHIEEMEKLSSKERMTTNDQKEFTRAKLSVEELDEEIRKLEAEEKENKEKVGEIFKRGSESTTDNGSFRRWLSDSATGKTTEPFKMSTNDLFRADPILSTNVTGVTPTYVANTDIMFTQSAELIDKLGIRVFERLRGKVSLPKLTEDVATWVAENEDASSANMAPTAITMSPNRVSHTQTITKEALALGSMNYTGSLDTVSTILLNLQNGIMNAVVEKIFDKIDSDCSANTTTIKGSTLTFSDIVNMEASLGTYNLARPAYVMSPETRAFCKKTAALTNQTPIWTNNKVNEINAYCTKAINGESIILGDFTKLVLGVWGDGIEIITDIYTGAGKGTVKFTALGFFDVAVHNPLAFTRIADASTY